MLYVALAACASTAVVSLVLGNLLRVSIRQGARERDRLVNQLCHLSGRPWEEAPAYAPEPAEEPDLLLVSPEQYVA